MQIMMLCVFGLHLDYTQTTMLIREALWPSGRASDSGARGVLEQDTFTSHKVLVIPRKRWLKNCLLGR